jgi:DNA-directed RNA polymerase II subunit RPB2
MENAEIWKIIDSYFRDNPQSLVRHHIESYNDFLKNGIFQIFKEKNPIRINTQFDKEINDYRSQCVMYFGGKDGSKIYFGKPVIYDDNNSHYMYPNEARLRNMTYGMSIHYDVEIEFIKILRKDEQPGLVGMVGGYEQDDKEFVNIKNNLDGGTVINDASTDIEGGSGKAPKRRQKRKTDLNLTPAETALFREAIEKSMIAPNIQSETIILEKIYLGNFPIMVQSNYCVLAGLPKEVRHSMGECYNDVGGYFIINGKEKTIVSQEKFGDNMLYIKDVKDDKYLYSAEIRSVSENVSKPIRTLSVKIVAPSPSYTYKNIVVNIPNVRKPVPLFVVFRALGVISDKQIITMCLLDIEKYDSMVDLFAPSVHDAGGILTQQLALKYIASLTKGKTVNHALEILADYFLPHIGEVNFTQKAYYLGYIVFRLLSVFTGLEAPTDRDNFKYKRIELVGGLLSELFREYYTLQQRQIHLAFEERVSYNKAVYEDNLKGLIDENYKEIFRDTKTVYSGIKKAFKGNWGAQSHTKRIGIVQDLNRLSHNSMMSHLRKTNLPLDASVKVVGPRVLHNTQWGFFDPIDTPDGANIGLHKHMSISAYITQGYSREVMLSWLREKIDMKIVEDCTPKILSTMTKVFVNGLWAGAINTPIESVEKIRLFRRNGLIPIYTSVTFDIKQNTVFIYTDSGRICRPIFYVDSETGKLSFDNELVKKKIESNDFKWNDLISGFNNKKDKLFNPNNNKIYELYDLYEGIDSESNPAKLKRFLEEKAILDYIDTNESENAMIALSKEELSKESMRKYTHMEIHESLIFGMMANLINFPENNPASRNSFSCGQSKQAVSMYHTNYQMRMDKTAVVLVNGQIPLVKTRYLEHINNEQNTYGENAIVAIMCYTGYNVEDAVLINEGALKRGLFRTTYYSTYESHEEKTNTGNAASDKTFTNIESESNIVGTKPGYDYSKLDKFGIIKENTEIDEKTVMIGLVSSSSDPNAAKIDMSKTPKKGQLGIVDKTFITDGEEGFRIAKVRIREERIPNLGDKMASRAGQKGTIGLIIPEDDMPFTRDGVRPDIIINPHAIPTRMTIGQLVEGITGKACAMFGGFGDCTAFNNNGSKIKVFGEMLSSLGYHSSGNEILYNGMTGEQLETEIFMGPTYYMRLKHMVKDKINYRALGPRTALTKQPVSGRANDGGLRIGEMERDSVISHGAAEFLRESMMERADKYYMAVCNNTGMVAIYNPSKNLFMSPMADGPIKYSGTLDGKDMRIENVTKFGRNFSVICIPYSLKLLIQELQTINVQMRIITEDNIQQLENMSYSKNITKLLNDVDAAPEDIVFKTRRIVKNINSNESNLLKVLENTEPEFKPNEPSIAPPNFKPYESPEYIPSNDEDQYMSPSPTNYNINPDSPQYNPYSSPEYIPDNSEKINMNPSPVYNINPDSPVFNPYEGMQGVNTDNLSLQAQQYNVGDLVHYRGDSTPSRFWKITEIGDRLITIKTEYTVGLGEMDNIQFVTAMDIYRPGDFSYNAPLAESVQPMAGIQQGNDDYSNSPYMQGGMPPPIHFAPVFKIMNGGNDFSSDATSAKEPEIPEFSNHSMPSIQVKESIAGSKPEEIQDTSAPLDFNKLIIKKV